MQEQTYEESLEAAGSRIDAEDAEQISLMKEAMVGHLEYCCRSDIYANPLDLPVSLAVTAAFNDVDGEGIYHLTHLIEAQINRCEITAHNPDAATLARLLFQFRRSIESNV
jgi:hypothetical protein